MALVDRYQCETCQQTAEVRTGSPAPDCGHTTTQMNRLEGGNWVRIESHFNHGLMTVTATGVHDNALSEAAAEVVDPDVVFVKGHELERLDGASGVRFCVACELAVADDADHDEVPQCEA